MVIRCSGHHSGGSHQNVSDWPSDLKGKQRNYNTPIRLNGTCCRMYNKINTPRDRCHISNCQQTSQLISGLKTKGRSKAPGGMSVSFVPMAAVVAILVIVSQVNLNIFCHCDTSIKSTDHHQTSTEAAVTTPLQHARKSPKLASDSHSNNQKEHLLSSLSESIERQHFRLKPIRALVQPRPSKFDSGQEYLSDEPSDQFRKLFAPRNTTTNHERIVLSQGTTMKKVDDGMRHILSMHEHAIMDSHRHEPLAVATASSIPTIPQVDTKRPWPHVTATNLFKQNPNKIVSQVLSYLSPSLGAKSNKLTSSATNSSSSSPSSSHRSNNHYLNPFSGRAIGQSPVVNTLINLGQKFVIPSRVSSTDSPQTSAVLVVPPELPSQASDLRQQQYAPTLPTVSRYTKQPFGVSVGKTFKSEPTTKNMIDDLSAEPSSTSPKSAGSVSVDRSSSIKNSNNKSPSLGKASPPRLVGSWFKMGANQIAQGYLQDSFRDLLTLSQLPILSGNPISTAPSELEPGGKHWMANRLAAQQARGNKTQAIDDLLRYAYIFGSGVRRKRDPLKVLGPSNAMMLVNQRRPLFSQRSTSLLAPKPSSATSSNSLSSPRRMLSSLLASKNAKPRGVMWDMATDPSLAVTVFHLLERASVALPLGFLLMPLVHMIRNPLNGFNLGRILPAKASHRSIDYEELAKRLDMMDKVLSRALRPTHRELSFMGK